MAGSKSNSLESEILDHILGGADWPRPATVFLALYTTAPSDSGGGVEVSGGSYARLSITNNATNFPAASGGAKSNGIDFVFPEATVAWGLVIAWALFDAVTAGNMLYWGDFTQTQTIGVGAAAKVKAGDLSFTEE
jgi:hypothetical protein